MNDILLITRPNHDCPTNYLFYWCELVIQEADKRSVKILDLSKNKANRKIFLSYIKKHQPKLIFFNGHGNQNEITGHNNEVLVSINSDNKILTSKIVYARSCMAASKLGKLCIKNGTSAFIGYKKNFILYFNKTKISKPLEDKIAALFLDPSNLIPISLIKGNSVMQAHQKSRESIKRNLNSILSSNTTKEKRDIAFALWRNLKNQVILGDGNAQLH